MKRHLGLGRDESKGPQQRIQYERRKRGRRLWSMYKKHAVYQHTLDFNPFQGINSNRINNYIFKIQNLIEEATNIFYAQNGQLKIQK